MAYSVKNIKLLRNGKLYSDLATAKSSIEAYVKITKGSENLDGIAILGRYNNDTQVSTVLGLVYSSGDTANITYVDSLSITNDITTINNNISTINSKIEEITGGTSGSIAEQIKKAIDALDYSDTAVSGQYVSSVSETDGVISVTREKLVASDMAYTDEMTVAATLKKLMDKNFPLTVGCSISPSALQEIGTTVSTVTINGFTATVDGKTVEITQKTVNGTSVTGTSWTASNVSATTTYKVNITAEGATKSADKTLTFVGPIYVGYSTASTPSETDMKALSKQSLRTSLQTITFNGTATASDGEYITIYSPYAVKQVMSAGFNIFSEFADTTFTYKGMTYHCYRHKAKTASANITFS